MTTSVIVLDPSAAALGLMQHQRLPVAPSPLGGGRGEERLGVIGGRELDHTEEARELTGRLRSPPVHERLATDRTGLACVDDLLQPVGRR